MGQCTVYRDIFLSGIFKQKQPEEGVHYFSLNLIQYNLMEMANLANIKTHKKFPDIQ